MSVAELTIAHTIVPKSDQLNADDLITGPITVILTKPRVTSDEQPVALHYEGDNGKPYKPCKSMRRVLVKLWGADANVYAGRALTLYRDDRVVFGGVAVGGIRISHMSHIDGEQTLALTTTRATRKPFTVKPLRAPEQRQTDRAPPPQTPPSQLTLAERADAYEKRLKEAPSTTKLESYRKAAAQLLTDLDAKDPERKVELDQLFNDRFIAIEDAGGEA